MNDKDQILNHLKINNPKSFTQRDFRLQLFPELNEDEIKSLLKEIITCNNDLIKYKEYQGTGYLAAWYSGNIDKFLNDGGFTKIEKDVETELELREKKEDLEGQILKLKRDNLRLKNWDIRIRWTIAIVSFIAGLVVKYLWDNK
ncbi:hypothetical protein [Aquimarina macrocephali]|uniref:hypothetical protein n=1 Tax=Aquimarina macrocephali TaxID=666563 RepID=UPI0004654683|nr:hypothetical protein [Aquimarina macrocephali]